MKAQYAGVHFPSNFDHDNFASRRTTGNNMYDPESTITGAELAAGMTYSNSRRAFPGVEWYLDVVHSVAPMDLALEFFPRVRL